MIIFKLSQWLTKGNKGLFDISVADQYSFMDSLGNAEDDMQRSYMQFRCQCFFSSASKHFFLSLLGLIVLPWLVVFFFVKGFFIRFSCFIDTIGEDKGMPEIMPLELTNHNVPNAAGWHAGYCLRQRDLTFLWNNRVFQKNTWFAFKLIVRIAQYSAIIAKYRPRTIVVHAEYSFCSSALTAYCHFYGVKHINVQHGEKLRYIRDSFFHFDECYVWHQHYVNLLTRQKAEPTQFRISIPPSLKIDASLVERQRNADYKYYLAEYSESELQSIVQSLSSVRKKGCSIIFRPHPRYSNLHILRKYVAEQDIELPEKVPILVSICNCDHAVGSFSTVLLQAFYAGKKVVLDDVTFRNRYDQLSSYGYFLIECPTIRLSSLSS